VCVRVSVRVSVCVSRARAYKQKMCVYVFVCVCVCVCVCVRTRYVRTYKHVSALHVVVVLYNIRMVCRTDERNLLVPYSLISAGRLQTVIK
jgi:hypothetical protein